MKNLILKSALIAFALCIFVSTNAQDSVDMNPAFSYAKTNDNETAKARFVTEIETDKSYRFSCRFNKEKTNAIRAYLNDALGNFDHEVNSPFQQWNHLPGINRVGDLEITLRDGQFVIKTKTSSEKARKELKAMANDIQHML